VQRLRLEDCSPRKLLDHKVPLVGAAKYCRCSVGSDIEEIERPGSEADPNAFRHAKPLLQ
jgi:hypothetical protein